MSWEDTVLIASQSDWTILQTALAQRGYVLSDGVQCSGNRRATRTLLPDDLVDIFEGRTAPDFSGLTNGQWTSLRARMRNSINPASRKRGRAHFDEKLAAENITVVAGVAPQGIKSMKR